MTKGNWVPLKIAFGLIAIVAIVFSLGRIAIINSDRKDAEKKRGDSLQRSLDDLEVKSSDDEKFFTIVKQLISTQDEAERKALIDQLHNFQFSSGAVHPADPISPSTQPSKRSSSTTTTISPSTTPATSVTTTTLPARPPPSSEPPSTTCITIPIKKLCIQGKEEL